MRPAEEERVDAAPVPAQVASGLASLAEAWLRDTVYCGVGLVSLVVAVCGFTAADGPAYAGLGVVAGLVAAAVPTVAIIRKAGVSRIWLALLVGVLVDAAALALILTS
jgi:hypothetical protein